ncbi:MULTISPECIES: hypothetical protein [Pseudoalteromonas]|uniref:hypothetical protein n=1 Tax=Pseudoalteromonas TaxID=53246 RepID=UPI00026CBEB4|nr:hypothetical protein [Pseudoalteromonas spongiae]
MSLQVTFVKMERGVVALKKYSLVLTNLINFCLLGQLECCVNWFQIILMNAEMRNEIFLSATEFYLPYICRAGDSSQREAIAGLPLESLGAPKIKLNLQTSFKCEHKRHESAR